MAVHLDDFQGMEFLNAARALAIIFDTMHPGKVNQWNFPAVNTGARRRRRPSRRYNSSVDALYADDILMLSSLAIQIKKEKDW